MAIKRLIRYGGHIYHYLGSPITGQFGGCDSLHVHRI